MIGNRAVALTLLKDLDEHLPPTYPDWLRQGWRFQRADILFLVGRQQDAFTSALEAVEPYDYQLISHTFAGEFARWVALMEMRGLTTRGNSVLRQLEASSHSFDFYDRVEVFYAGKALGRDLPDLGISDSTTLPRGLESELARYGMRVPPSAS
jgi:hypothetical protein